MLHIISLTRLIMFGLFFGLPTFVTLATAPNLIPNSYVESFLKDYSQEEMNLIEDDLIHINKLCFRNHAPAMGQPVYVATAGGPAASKSTILETWLVNNPHFIYVDPDSRALRLMTNTYLQSLTYYSISKASSYQDLLKSAYNKWRAASNYIASTLLNNAFEKGYHIAHGTTSTAKEVAQLYSRLKDKNYKIVLLLCGSSDGNRVKAIRNRSSVQGFVQVTEEDTIKKAKLFPERFPVYFQYADELHFYWTEDFSKGSVKAATFDKTKGLIVENQQAYDRFVKWYNQERQETKGLEPFGSFIEQESKSKDGVSKSS